MSRLTPTRILRFDSLRSTPWANGRGRSTEVVALGASVEWTGASTPPWRLSVAELVEVGEFSFLPGLDRQFLPVNTTVGMEVDGEVHLVHDGTVHAFAGESNVSVTALSHAGVAINLMVTRAPAPNRLLLLPSGDAASSSVRRLASIALSDEDPVRRFDLVWGKRPLEKTHAVLAVASG